MNHIDFPSTTVRPRSTPVSSTSPARQRRFGAIFRSRNPARICSGLALLLLPALAFAQVPSYRVDLMGPGHGSMNNPGVVIGNERAGPGTPWVNNGSGRLHLPLPANASAGSVADINDAGVIVGTVDTDGDSVNDTPVKWTPNTQGSYSVEALPLAGKAARGKAIAINNNGVILAEGFGIDFLPTYTAYVIDNVRVTHLRLFNARDINDNGIILTKTGLYDYNNAKPLAFAPLPDHIPNGLLYPASINNNNEVVVNIWTTNMSHTSYHAIGIYKIGKGWVPFMDVQTTHTAGSMNDHGDMTLPSKNPGCGMVYLNNLKRFFCPASLLDGASRHWTVSSASVIANDRSILARGANRRQAQSGLVRLSTAADLAPPQAPMSLVAKPHEPTFQQPFTSIDLSWRPADSLSERYIIERKGPADTDFAVIASTTNRFYRDSDIVGGKTYAYRVSAAAAAGRSTPSQIISIPAPRPAPKPVDNPAPVILSTSVRDGDVIPKAKSTQPWM